MYILNYQPEHLSPYTAYSIITLILYSSHGMIASGYMANIIGVISVGVSRMTIITVSSFNYTLRRLSVHVLQHNV